MKYKVFNLSGAIDINGKLENQFEETSEELPEEIKRLFDSTALLTLVAIQLNTPNGIVAAVYKKVNE